MVISHTRTKNMIQMRRSPLARITPITESVNAPHAYVSRRIQRELAGGDGSFPVVMYGRREDPNFAPGITSQIRDDLFTPSSYPEARAAAAQQELLALRQMEGSVPPEDLAYSISLAQSEYNANKTRKSPEFLARLGSNRQQLRSDFGMIRNIAGDSNVPVGSLIQDRLNELSVTGQQLVAAGQDVTHLRDEYARLRNLGQRLSPQEQSMPANYWMATTVRQGDHLNSLIENEVDRNVAYRLWGMRYEEPAKDAMKRLYPDLKKPGKVVVEMMQGDPDPRIPQSYAAQTNVAMNDLLIPRMQQGQQEGYGVTQVVSYRDPLGRVKSRMVTVPAEQVSDLISDVEFRTQFGGRSGNELPMEPWSASRDEWGQYTQGGAETKGAPPSDLVRQWRYELGMHKWGKETPDQKRALLQRSEQWKAGQLKKGNREKASGTNESMAVYDLQREDMQDPNTSTPKDIIPVSRDFIPAERIVALRDQLSLPESFSVNELPYAQQMAYKMGLKQAYLDHVLSQQPSPRVLEGRWVGNKYVPQAEGYQKMMTEFDPSQMHLYQRTPIVEGGLPSPAPIYDPVATTAMEQVHWAPIPSNSYPRLSMTPISQTPEVWQHPSTMSPVFTPVIDGPSIRGALPGEFGPPPTMGSGAFNAGNAVSVSQGRYIDEYGAVPARPITADQVAKVQAYQAAGMSLDQALANIPLPGNTNRLEAVNLSTPETLAFNAEPNLFPIAPARHRGDFASTFNSSAPIEIDFVNGVPVTRDWRSNAAWAPVKSADDQAVADLMNLNDELATVEFRAKNASSEAEREHYEAQASALYDEMILTQRAIQGQGDPNIEGYTKIAERMRVQGEKEGKEAITETLVARMMADDLRNQATGAQDYTLLDPVIQPDAGRAELASIALQARLDNINRQRAVLGQPPISDLRQTIRTEPTADDLVREMDVQRRADELRAVAEFKQRELDRSYADTVLAQHEQRKARLQPINDKNQEYVDTYGISQGQADYLRQLDERRVMSGATPVSIQLEDSGLISMDEAERLEGLRQRLALSNAASTNPSPEVRSWAGRDLVYAGPNARTLLDQLLHSNS